METKKWQKKISLLNPSSLGFRCSDLHKCIHCYWPPPKKFVLLHCYTLLHLHLIILCGICFKWILISLFGVLDMLKIWQFDKFNIRFVKINFVVKSTCMSNPKYYSNKLLIVFYLQDNCSSAKKLNFQKMAWRDQFLAHWASCFNKKVYEQALAGYKQPTAGYEQVQSNNYLLQKKVEHNNDE